MARVSQFAFGVSSRHPSQLALGDLVWAALGGGDVHAAPGGLSAITRGSA